MPEKILIVEDEDLMREALRDIAGEMGYSALAAADGQEALEMFNREDFNLLITDIKMPRMSGIDLIRSIREDPRGREVEIMIISAWGKMEYTLGAIQLGVHHFLLKPFEPLEFKKQVVHCLETLKIREAKRKMEEERELDLREAAYVQKALMMSEEEAARIAGEGGVHLSLIHRPFLPTSGDFIWVKKIGPGKTLFLLLDVCGHGTAAAMIGVRLFNIIDSADRADLAPKDFLALIHNNALAMMPKGRFVACSCAVYDAREKIITIANAANPPPMNGLTGEEIPAYGPPLGQKAGAVFTETALPFPAGSRLVLLSDGIIEAQNLIDEMYGDERLSGVIRDSKDCPIGELKEEIAVDLEIFCEGRKVEDDVTVLILEAGK